MVGKGRIRNEGLRIWLERVRWEVKRGVSGVDVEGREEQAKGGGVHMKYRNRAEMK